MEETLELFVHVNFQTTTNIKSRNWSHNHSPVPSPQAKLAARRVRRQQEARRQAEETAAQRILEEQNQAIAANRPIDVDHVIVPDVIVPRETSEEEVRIYNGIQCYFMGVTFF